MNPYEILGKWGTDDGKPLPKDADKAMVRKAYRLASKKTHPDRNGGDVNAMIAVNVAYDILSDAKRRERCDLGQDDEPVTHPLELRARNVLAQVFMQAVQEEGRVNYVARAKNHLSQMTTQLGMEIREIERTMAKISERIKLVVFEPKEHEVNVWEDQLTASLGQMNDLLETKRQTIKACDKARELLIAYKCSVIETPEHRYSGLEAFILRR